MGILQDSIYRKPKLARNAYFPDELQSVLMALYAVNVAVGASPDYTAGFNSALRGVALALGLVELNEEMFR